LRRLQALHLHLEKNILLARPPQSPYNENHGMLTPDQISELHRLRWAEKWPLRKIARQMRIGRRTIAK